MDEKTGIELLESIKDLKVSDVEYIDDDEEILIKIIFTNEESIIIVGSDIDVYLAIKKDQMVH